ncbi:MAG: hypothetical protein CMH49_04135 [Myxococcales bacterium]|nr:hypothetical protein [Myxococcales bacterium]
MSSLSSSNPLKSSKFILQVLCGGLFVYSLIQFAPLLVNQSHAQKQREVRGLISSESGVGIKGALVSLLGSSTRTKTDRFGKFKLSTTLQGSQKLKVSAKGYQSKTHEIKLDRDFTNVMITLQTKTSNDEDETASQLPEPTHLEMAPPKPSVSSSRRAPAKRSRRAKTTFGLSISGTGHGGGGLAVRSKAGKKRSRRRGSRRRAKRIVQQAPLQAAMRPKSPSEQARGDEYKKIDENDFKDPKAEPLSTLSIDVDTASYSNLRRFIQNGQYPPKDSVKLEEMINYFDYSYSAPTEKDKHPFSVTTELADAPWNPKHKLMHIGLQGRKIDADKLPPSNLVFLLDVSGSMNGPDRLPLLKQALMLLSGTLRAQDKVSIVVYAGSAGLVLPPTAGSERRTIIEAFSKLRAGGSTAGGAGIKLAYKIAKEQFIKGGNNRVILATDGDFNVGVRSQAELVRMIEKQRKSGVFLTVLGFGRGNYRSSTMSDLAEKGNGNHAYIDSILEAQKVLVSQMGGTLFTIAKDVKIQVEFNPLKVGRYRLLGYQSRILAAADFNNDKKDAGELGAGHSVTALYELIPPEDVKGQAGQVDQLKYQEAKTRSSDEWLTVKLRYKKPDGDKSTLMTHPHQGDQGDWREASEDFRFSAGVASFGMMLRDSKHFTQETRTSKWNLVKSTIKGALGKDHQGYRSELLDLAKRAEKLKP